MLRFSEQNMPNSKNNLEQYLVNADSTKEFTAGPDWNLYAAKSKDGYNLICRQGTGETSEISLGSIHLPHKWARTKKLKFLKIGYRKLEEQAIDDKLQADDLFYRGDIFLGRVFWRNKLLVTSLFVPPWYRITSKNKMFNLQFKNKSTGTYENSTITVNEPLINRINYNESYKLLTEKIGSNVLMPVQLSEMEFNFKYNSDTRHP